MKEKEDRTFKLIQLSRPIIVFFSLGIGYYFLKNIYEISLIPLIWIFSLSFLLSLISLISERKGRKFHLSYLIADSILILSIMHFTGGPESSFTILFFLLILISSFYLKREKFFFFTFFLIFSYNLFLFLWSKEIFKTPFELDFLGSELLLRGYIFTLSFIIVSILTYVISERARKGERKALKLDFLTKEIIKNLGEIVFLRNEKGETLFSNRNLDKKTLGLIEKNKNSKEVQLNGKIYYLSYKKFTLLDENFEIFVLRDITKEKEIEEYLKTKEKEEFLTELSKGLAHEIRNPLASIQGAFTTLLKIRDNNKKEKLIKLIKKEIERLNNMVKSFTEYSKLNKIKKETIPLEILLKEIAGEFKIKNLFLNNSKNYITCDPYLLKIAISNFVRNAIEAVNEETEKVKIEVKENKNKIEIIIEDKGPGMEKNELEKIRFPFYTTKTSGMGMGIPLAEKILKLHGYDFEIKSKKGEGTKVIIIIKK